MQKSSSSDLRRNSHESRGSSMIEFAIATPFLLALSVGLIDIGRGLREYFLLKSAVTSGAERAMSLADLPGDVEFATQGVPNCSGSVDSNHSRIHERVLSILALQGNALQDTCVQSDLALTVDPENPVQPLTSGKQNTVHVRASAKFKAFFPMFNGFVIAAETRMPYLRSS